MGIGPIKYLPQTQKINKLVSSTSIIKSQLIFTIIVFLYRPIADSERT